ncbi:MAG: hypothetical protein COT15_04635 [Candidatus Diapherotrites archaeon CG08_land_8_20_14_0_20_34_12]|nr:MAG: hypothetical protein COT15_04635 [Candidatus Diapherotrites archaeon CG08_land_8_20_14_0_20_34_12]
MTRIGEILINALINSLSLLIRKPYLFLASLVFSLISMVAFFLNIETITYFFLNIAYGIIPNISPKTVLFDTILMYYNEIIILVLVLLFILLMNFLAYAVYSAFVKEITEGKKDKASFTKAFSDGLSKALPLLGFVFIVFFLCLFLASVCLFFMWLVGNNFLATLIILLLLGILSVYLALKLLFVVPALFDVESKASRNRIKSKNSVLAQAIAKSWNFSSKNMSVIFVLLLILAFVTSFLSSLVGVFVYPILDINVKLGVTTILTSIISTYSYLVLPYYYFKK